MLLLGRFKEKKLVDLGLVALNNFYGHALSIDQIFNQVDNIIFPKKEGQKVPPHAQIGALNFINGAVIKHQFPMSPAETKDVADLGMRVLTKISDPKVSYTPYIAGHGSTPKSIVHLLLQLIRATLRDHHAPGCQQVT